MTLLERDERMREEGRKEGLKTGREEATLNAVINLMKTAGVSVEKAMDMLGIAAEEKEDYLSRL